MEVKLIISSGKHAGKEFAMPGAQMLIGSAAECQLRPTGDDIERRHCTIFTQEGELLIRDFNSRSGTFVNGTAVKGHQTLKTGDRVRVGRLEFDVRIAVDVGGKKKPKVHSIKEAAARLVQSAAAEDLDISQWLTATDHTPDEYDTSEFQVQRGDGGASLSASNEPKKSSLFGAEAEEKPVTSSSKEAAAELLKQMLNPKPFGRK
jgi:predicted component of type VI protein secretion system